MIYSTIELYFWNVGHYSSKWWKPFNESGVTFLLWSEVCHENWSLRGGTQTKGRDNVWATRHMGLKGHQEQKHMQFRTARIQSQRAFWILLVHQPVILSKLVTLQYDFPRDICLTFYLYPHNIQTLASISFRQHFFIWAKWWIWGSIPSVKMWFRTIFQIGEFPANFFCPSILLFLNIFLFNKIDIFCYLNNKWSDVQYF